MSVWFLHCWWTCGGGDTGASCGPGDGLIKTLAVDPKLR